MEAKIKRTKYARKWCVTEAWRERKRERCIDRKMEGRRKRKRKIKRMMEEEQGQ